MVTYFSTAPWNYTSFLFKSLHLTILYLFFSKCLPDKNFRSAEHKTNLIQERVMLPVSATEDIKLTV